MQIIKYQEYNAIETMSGVTHYSEATKSNIQKALEGSKFLDIGGSLVAVNQIILVRRANSIEYSEKFILPFLSISIKPKLKSWLQECQNSKSIPTLEQLSAKIGQFEEEEQKFSQEIKLTPEQIQERAIQIKEVRERIFKKQINKNSLGGE